MQQHPPSDMARRFDEQLRRDPDMTALVVGDQRYTRQKLHDRAETVMTTLLADGAEPGDAVVCVYDTGFAEMAVALATARLGGVFIPIPKRMGVAELHYIVELADPAAVVLRDAGAVAPFSEIWSGAIHTTDDVAAAIPTPMEPHDWDEHDTPAVIGFTSGTTGRPKGVMHSWAAMDWVGDLLTERSRAQYGESICVTGAGAGVPGFTFYTYWGLSRGLPIVKSERWDPQRVLELMARERCVWSVMVPTMLHMLMDARRTTGQDLDISAMRSISIGGSPMTADFIADARRLMGFEPLRVYAMAEIMMHNHMRLDDPVDDRDVKDGRPGPGCEIGIFDEHQRHLPVGETGEVGMRGPSLMLGYLGDPEGKSSKLTPDGYFLSGDLGRIDDEGYIRIVGRMKDMIIRGGYNIDPSEVEALIRLMPGVRDVAVVGYPDPVFGERACACIWRPDGTETGLAEVAEHLLGVGLTKEKLPERVICFEQIPQSPDGKILKGELRKQLAAEPALPGGS